MPIRSQDIDPTLTLALKDRLAQLVSTQVGLEPRAARLRSSGMNRWRETVRRNAYHFWAAGACVIGSFAALPAIAHTGPQITVTALLAMQALGVGLVCRGFRITNQAMTEVASPELLRSAGELIALSRAERIYCDGVAALMDAEQALPEKTQGEILAQLNDLLTSFRKLEGTVQRSLAARGSQPIEGLEGELAGLVRLRDRSADPAARATIEQSISLCSQRLADARSLAPFQEQAEAQQGLILQVMASVQASLSRMAAAESVAVQADVDELQRAVLRANRETRAVEDAVNEVIALRA